MKHILPPILLAIGPSFKSSNTNTGDGDGWPWRGAQCDEACSRSEQLVFRAPNVIPKSAGDDNDNDDDDDEDDDDKQMIGTGMTIIIHTDINAYILRRQSYVGFSTITFVAASKSVEIDQLVAARLHGSHPQPQHYF